jgi:hypothetical protein
MLAGHAAEAQAPAQSPATAHSPATAQARAPSGADEIYDIRGPKPLGGNGTIPLVVLAGVLLGAAAYGSWIWSRRRARPPQTPAEIAFERLTAAQWLIEAQNGREFSIEVSGIVRDYIEQQFLVQAAHRTTDEFLHDLVEPAQPDAAHRALAAHRGSLAAFLETCDLAKIGGWELSAADMETLRAGAVRFVTESAPITADSPAGSPAGTTKETGVPSDKAPHTPAHARNTPIQTPTPADLPRLPANGVASPLPKSSARSSDAAFPAT